MEIHRGKASEFTIQMTDRLLWMRDEIAVYRENAAGEWPLVAVLEADVVPVGVPMLAATAYGALPTPLRTAPMVGAHGLWSPLRPHDATS